MQPSQRLATSFPPTRRYVLIMFQIARRVDWFDQRVSAELADGAGPERGDFGFLVVDQAADAADLELEAQRGIVVDRRAAEHAGRRAEGEAAGGAQRGVRAAQRPAGEMPILELEREIVEVDEIHRSLAALA